MKQIAQGLNAVSNVLDSAKPIIDTLAEMEEDEKEKEDETLELIKDVMNGDVSKENIDELIQEEKVEVKEEDKIVQGLKKLVQEEKSAEQQFKDVIAALGQEEQQTDNKLIQLSNLISQIENDGSVELTKETMTKMFSESKTAADMILDEANEELQASNLSRKLAKELGFSVEEIINAEKLEQEEEFEERKLEELAQRINSQRLEQLLQELERHTAKDEQETREEHEMIVELIEESEAAEEQLEGETKHTYEEAEQLKSMLREIRKLGNQAGMADEDFQQNFGQLMDEVEEAEKEAEQAAENEQEAEQTEEKAEQKAQQSYPN